MSEAAAVAVAGGVLGGAVGTLVGLPVPGALVGAANGALCGVRQIYDWRTPRGWAAFVLDSTWALPTTAAGLAAHLGAAVRGRAGFVPGLSRRQNRHVYARGLQFRRGFAITLGNVVSGAGDVSRPRRVKLVTDHEDVHVWQARWLGPLYVVGYAGWMIGGTAIGAVGWLRRRVLGRGDVRFTQFVETCAYYLNPFEYWAYSRDGHWPPSGIAPGVGPQRPLVRPLAERRQAT